MDLGAYCLSFVFYSNLNGKGPRYFRGLKLKYKNGRQKNYLHVLLRVMFCIIIIIIIIMKNNHLKVSSLSSCHETSRRFLRYGNSFPSTFPEVLLAHASQMTGQLSQSMHRIYTVSSSSYLHALRQLASHLTGVSQ